MALIPCGGTGDRYGERQADGKKSASGPDVVDSGMICQEYAAHNGRRPEHQAMKRFPSRQDPRLELKPGAFRQK